MKAAQKKGISLMELAISLTVMALIVGVALSATSLIKTGKMRRIVSEKEAYELSLSGFCNRYDGLPGDLIGATQYWTTVDGDGNGQINFKSGSVYEGYRAWQQLSLAQMVNGIYAGTQTTSAATIETDIPGSVITGAGFLLDYGVGGFSTNNVAMFGRPVATSATPVLVSGILTPQEAQTIDGKSDDGKPNTGKIHGRDGNGSSANSCYDSTNKIYALTATGVDCTLAFMLEGLDSCE